MAQLAPQHGGVFDPGVLKRHAGANTHEAPAGIHTCPSGIPGRGWYLSTAPLGGDSLGRDLKSGERP